MTVTPISPASRIALLMAVRSLARQVLSGPPQLIEMTDGLFTVSWAALVIAWTNPCVGVRGEVDDDLRLGGDGAGDLDVEHDLAVGAVGVVAGGVGPAQDRDGRDRRRRQPEARRSRS